MLKNKIQEFWDNQAMEFQNSSLATSPDTIAFKMEFDTTKHYLSQNDKICDMGCGNGQKAKMIVESLECDYLGIDFSEQMIKSADLLRKKLLEENSSLRLKFKQGDVLDEKLLDLNSFDKIISSRCLINLQNYEQQKRAIKNIYSFLKKDGLFICIENTLEALQNLNQVRSQFGLEAIDVRWHNCYFKEKDLLDFLKDYFICEKIDNFASTYYLISRTLNALIKENDKVDYNSKINILSAKLPPLGDFSPMKCFVLRKK